jgi:DNA modification methylase
MSCLNPVEVQMPFDDLIQFSNSQSVQILIGDCLEILQTLPESYFQTCVTSPPYFGLRDYQVDGQIGMEQTPDTYVAKLVDVFHAVRRVLRDDGTLWLNLGDSYANDGKWGGASSGKHVTALHGTTGVGRGKRFTGAKAKDLLGMPWRVAFALQEDGWWLRSAIVWHKPNPMPESVKDRPTSAYEMVFLLAKSAQYYYDADAIREPTVCDRTRGPALHGDLMSTNGNAGLARRPITDTRNNRNVWTITTQPFKGAHFATMPPNLAERCILAGCPEGGSVIDPFGGAGTTGFVAGELNRRATLIELNPDYAEIARNRLGHLAAGP